MASHLARIFSRYFGKAFITSRACSDSVEQSSPITAKTIATTLRTAIARGNLHRSSRDTTGANKKLINTARISGSRNSFAQTKTDRIPKRYANGTSVPASNCFPAMVLLGKATRTVLLLERPFWFRGYLLGFAVLSLIPQLLSRPVRLAPKNAKLKR
jgi:hypothetical protein